MNVNTYSSPSIVSPSYVGSRSYMSPIISEQPLSSEIIPSISILVKQKNLFNFHINLFL
jgi:hypothetical protein